VTSLSATQDVPTGGAGLKSARFDGIFNAGQRKVVMKNVFKYDPWVTVAVFEDEAAGKALETALTSKGFEVRTYHDRLLQLFLFLCPPRATHRVQVRQRDYVLAKEYVDKESAQSPLVQRAIHCPACGSLRVNYPQMTRKFFLPTLLLHVGIIFRIIDHEAYCDHCHYTWNLPKRDPAGFTKVPRPIH